MSAKFTKLIIIDVNRGCQCITKSTRAFCATFLGKDCLLKCEHYNGLEEGEVGGGWY